MKNQAGFTLIEIMVAVAIISILSTIAIPQYQKFQARSKTAEAKLQLSSIYTSETGFEAESDVFATCLYDMGYRPNQQSQDRYYSTGFHLEVSSPNTIVNNVINGVTCNTNNSDEVSFFRADKTTYAMEIINQEEINNTFIEESGSGYVAAAQGWISQSFIKNNSEEISAFLQFVISKAYAQKEISFINPVGADSSVCRELWGASLFTINENKKITVYCNGF